MKSANLASPQGQDLIELAASVGRASPASRTAIRLEIWDELLSSRQAGRRSRVAAKTADAVAKFGGGSLLTATVLLLITGQSSGWLWGTAALTLLSFIIGTISSAVIEARADGAELEAQRLEVVLQETANLRAR